jgi:tRNA modification GTPase
VSALDPDRLDRVVGLAAQSGRIDELERQTGDGDGPNQDVTRSPGDGRGDGRLAFHQGVEERTFSGIGRTGDDHPEPLAKRLGPRPGDAALNERQHRLLAEAETLLVAAGSFSDPLLIAEHLRLVRVAFDALIGRATTEHMLDALFGRFCIGK